MEWVDSYIDACKAESTEALKVLLRLSVAPQTDGFALLQAEQICATSMAHTEKHAVKAKYVGKTQMLSKLIQLLLAETKHVQWSEGA